MKQIPIFKDETTSAASSLSPEARLRQRQAPYRQRRGYANRKLPSQAQDIAGHGRTSQGTEGQVT
jgi:hypothetical protein